MDILATIDWEMILGKNVMDWMFRVTFLASVVVAITPDPEDDKRLSRLLKIFRLPAFAIGHAEPAKKTPPKDT